MEENTPIQNETLLQEKSESSTSDDLNLAATSECESVNSTEIKRSSDEPTTSGTITSVGKRFLVLLTGNTLNAHKTFVDHLRGEISDLQEVDRVDECDFILVFCPVVSRAGTDIKAAEHKLQRISETKPAVLVVLHHTFDPEFVVPDSSRAVTRKNVLPVDCLFYEDQGLLQCTKNNVAYNTVKYWIEEQVMKRIQIAEKEIDESWEDLSVTEDSKNGSKHPSDEEQMDESQPQELKSSGTITSVGKRFLVLLTGNTLNAHKTFVDHLRGEISDLQEVDRVDECDFILVFCPVVSRAGTDIKAAEHKLQRISETKPAVLVVLHHTFDPESVVSDSSRAVTRENVLPVDCLFYEDQGLLHCMKNNVTYNKVKYWIEEQVMKRIQIAGQVTEKQKTEGDESWVDLGMPEVFKNGSKTTSDEEQMDESQPQELKSSGNKPAVLVVLHHIFDPEYVVPDSTRVVTEEVKVKVDYLFHEDQGLLQCTNNNVACNQVKHLEDQVVEIKLYSQNAGNLQESFSGKSILLIEKTLNFDMTFGDHFKNKILRLREVPTVEESDFILAFYTVTLHNTFKETGIEIAVKKLQDTSVFNCERHKNQDLLPGYMEKWDELWKNLISQISDILSQAFSSFAAFLSQVMEKEKESETCKEVAGFLLVAKGKAPFNGSDEVVNVVNTECGVSFPGHI